MQSCDEAVPNGPVTGGPPRACWTMCCATITGESVRLSGDSCNHARLIGIKLSTLTTPHNRPVRQSRNVASDAAVGMVSASACSPRSTSWWQAGAPTMHHAVAALSHTPLSCTTTTVLSTTIHPSRTALTHTHTHTHTPHTTHSNCHCRLPQPLHLPPPRPLTPRPHPLHSTLLPFKPSHLVLVNVFRVDFHAVSTHTVYCTAP